MYTGEPTVLVVGLHQAGLVMVEVTRSSSLSLSLGVLMTLKQHIEGYSNSVD